MYETGLKHVFTAGEPAILGCFLDKSSRLFSCSTPAMKGRKVTANDLVLAPTLPTVELNETEFKTLCYTAPLTLASSTEIFFFKDAFFFFLFFLFFFK